MIKYDDSVDVMLSKINALKGKLEKQIIEIASTRETTINYFSGKQRELRNLYDEMRQTFKSWANTYIPKEYNAAISNAIADLKQMQVKSNINISEIKNMQSSVQYVHTLINDSISNFSMALDNGRKTLNKVLISTQQLNISEKQINQDIVEGWEGKGGRNTNAVKKRLRDDLVKNSLDGKTVKIIDVNGNERVYDVDYYAEMVARTKLRESQTAGVLQTANNLNQDLVQISPNPTECDICSWYAGRIFSISGDDPDFPILDDDPPFHPHCYSKDTEIYTNEGWKIISEINGNELCLSLNPDNFNLEYVRIINIFKNFENKMISFKSKIADILVTQKHNMFFQNDWNRKVHKEKFEFIEAVKLSKIKSGRFFASSKWQGGKIDDNYCEFMGYFLSEGNSYKISENSYQIKISQSRKVNKNKYEKMLDCLKRTFKDKHICEQPEGMIFYDAVLGKKLNKLGKSYEKYIPDEILISDIENIRIFLDAYRLGDGSERKRNKFYIFKKNGRSNRRIDYKGRKKTELLFTESKK
jgi:hypothetical protein